MSSSICKMAIGDICQNVTSGGTPSRKVDKYWIEGTIDWFKTGELNDWYINHSEEKITDEALSRSSAKLFPAKTVLMAMYGDGKTITTLGILTAPASTNQACCAMITDPSRCNPLFLFYSLKYHRHELLTLVVAGAQRNLSNGIIKNFAINYFPIEQQTRIVASLSTYDDLIENNRRRIQLLEESARLLYKEWFVHLRFPGHESGKVIDGVPEGWERKMLCELAGINKASLSKGYQGEIEYIDISSVSPDVINETTILSFKESPSRARRIVFHGDIIWSCVRPNRRSHAVIWRPADNLIASTGFAVISPNNLNLTPFLYYSTTTQDYVDYLSSVATGAAYPAVKPNDFNRSKILVPKHSILDDFAEVILPVFEQIYVLTNSNRKLAQARDLLLPRLMNGEIEV